MYGMDIMEKLKQNKYFTISAGIAAGILGGTLAALVLELNGHIFLGILLHIIILIPGLSGQLFCMNRLQSSRQQTAEPVPPRQDAGNVMDLVNTYLAQTKDLEDILHTEASEREAIVSHLETVSDKIFVQFSEIEALANQGIEALNGIEVYLGSFNMAVADQSQGLEQLETQTSGITELMGSLTKQLEKSSGQAGNLEKNIANGETQALAVNEIIKQISKDVETITQLTATINQISAQTNILSMNAAIESAHAGAVGAGFAVVADEIRKLSELTRENAKNIQEVLSAIVQKTANALKASDTSAQNLNGITEAIKDFNRDLSGITGTAQEGNTISEDMASSIGKQKDLTHTIKDSNTDIVVHNQSFRVSLEHIQTLTDKTRTEIKEIRSGTQEVLRHIQKTEQSFFKNFEETESIRAIIPE
jgi:methyl-accepting chemotaxis protein